MIALNVFHLNFKLHRRPIFLLVGTIANNIFKAVEVKDEIC